MERLSADVSPAYLPFDVAISPAQKSSFDTSLLGVFDEALRQAAQPDAQPAYETQSSRRSTKPEAVEKSEDDGGADEVRSEEGGETPATATETRPNEGPQDTESGCEDSDDQGASDERAEADDTEEAEESGEVEVAEIIVEIAVPVVEEAVDVPSEAETLEAMPVDGGAAEPVGKSGGTQTPGAVRVNVPAEQGTAEPETEKGAQATELPSDTFVTKVEDETSGEGQAESEKKVVTDQRVEGELEEPAAEDTEKAESSSEAGVGVAEPTEEESDKHKSGKREKKHPGEPVSKAGGEVAHTDGVPKSENAASASVELSQVERTETATAPVVETASPADLGTTTGTNQGSGAVDALAAGTATTNSVQSQAVAGRGSATETAHGVDSAKFVQRVANAFSALGQRSDATVRLKLHPAELGSLRMEITVKNGALNARVEAETTTVQNLLVENLPALRERLAEQGIKVERFDVGVSDQSQGGLSERPDSGGRSFHQSQRGADSPADRITTETDSTDGHGSARLSVDGRLDVFI